MKAVAVKMKDDDRWRAESDLDTLLSAARIRRDAKRYAAAMKIAAERKQDIDNLKKKQ